jgi:hypothetical protein
MMLLFDYASASRLLDKVVLLDPIQTAELVMP